MNNTDELPESIATRRVPKCAKCRNHKIISTKKGHKGMCRFEQCDCPKCRITDERRAVMKSHIKIRRQLEKEEKRHQSLQTSSVGPSIETVNNQMTATTLPSIQWSFGPMVYNMGSQSTISEVSQQSWGSAISVSGLDSNERIEENYLLM